MNFGVKGRAFTDFLQSVSSGIIYGDKRKKLVLSDINTQCIVEYTHILLDKIHLPHKFGRFFGNNVWE